MKVYFINLERAVERRKHMEEQALRLGIDSVRIEAVDGQRLSPSECARVCPSIGRTHQLAPVEVACFLSHRKVWLQIADGSESHGLVLEDDLLLSSDFRDFTMSQDWIPGACGIIKIETIARPILLTPPKFDAGKGRLLWHMASANMGGGGYILSRLIAKYLLENTLTFSDPVDCVLFDPQSFVWQNTGAYQMVPALCVQQIRSKSIFLDANAAASQMDGQRGTIKRRGLAKIWTELTRPFLQLIMAVILKSRAFFTGGRYSIVSMK